MTEHHLTEEDLIAELNSQLRKDTYYQEGMAFMAYPEGARGRGVRGYSTTGPMRLTGVYVRVAHEVFSRPVVIGSITSET